MAAINFVKGEQYYTAEFQINGPVNVHIERAEAGALYFRQRSIDHGSYDLINGANWNNRGDLTIDTAIQGVVYPMWIKIESASEPTLAEMVEGEQSGGGAGTAEPEIVYLTEANGMILELALAGPAYLAKYKDGDNIVIGSIASVAANFGQGTVQPADIIAISFFKTEVYFSDGSSMSFDEFISLMTNAGANLIEITKEQFYNLEA